MDVNDNAQILDKRGVLESIASKLAPTGGHLSSIGELAHSTIAKSARPTGFGVDPFTFIPRPGANPGKNTNPSDSNR
ncbi:hypothetical protein BSF40_56390 [Pseudomonas sp. ACN5]|nr:hypothetical protein BSF40_56390 [Pseudomonas sp. ACN5]